MAHTKKAVVSGGGPVGAFAAIALATQGWTVEVHQYTQESCCLRHTVGKSAVTIQLH